MNVFIIMKKLIKEIIFVHFIRFILFLTFYASKELFQRVFSALHFSLLSSGGRCTMINFARIKSVSGGFFCELFATCCRWTIDWLPCGLRVVFFVTYQGREYQGMHLELWSMILVGMLSYYISCFTSSCNKKRRTCTNSQSANLKKLILRHG